MPKKRVKTLQELKAEVRSCRADLESYGKRPTSSALVEGLKSRIRDLESQIRQVED